MKLRTCLLLTGSLTILLGCASPTAKAPRLSTGRQQEAIDHLKRFIEEEMRTTEAQGLSIAIVRDQAIVWEQGFGWADKEKHQRADERTLYRAGSISKLLTDVGALELAASGRLDLDAPVRQVLPDFAPVAPDGRVHPITPRMLMTHHSGLPRDVLKGFMSSRPAPFGDVIGQLNAMGADDVPMRGFAYSNAGISVLGAVVAATTGQPFESWMRDSVLRPLEMNDSSFEAGLSQSDRMARGHSKGRATVEPGLRDVPAGGLNSSVHELSNFVRMVFADGRFKDRQLLPAKWARAMLSPQNTQVPLDAGFQVGLGWMLSSLSQDTPTGLGPVAHHSGATRLFNSQMYVLPQQKIGVIVMANEQNAHALVDRIALRALNVQLQVQLGHQHEPSRTSPWASAQRSRESSQQEQNEGRWAGLYSTAVGPVHILQASEGAPEAEAFGKSFVLRMRENGARSPVLSLVGLIPVELEGISALELTRQNIDGVQAIVAHLGGQSMLLGSRVPQAPIPDAWRHRVGAYRITNQGEDSIAIKDLQIRIKGSNLILSYVDLDAGVDATELILRPLSDTSAQALLLLPDAGPRVRAERVSGKEQLSFGGFLAERQTP